MASIRAHHAKLRPIETFPERNPFTRETRTISTPDSADVWIDGACVGPFFWDNFRLVCPLEFAEHRNSLQDVAIELATRLGATVELP